MRHTAIKGSGQVKGETDPKLVIVSWWTLLDKGTVVRGYVAVVAVFFQHVDFSFDLLFFLLRDVHHLDGSQLARLHVTALTSSSQQGSVKFKMNSLNVAPSSVANCLIITPLH